LNCPSRKIALQLEVSYPTVLKAVIILRRAILTHHPGGKKDFSAAMKMKRKNFLVGTL
jgi:hypothetical protein